MTQPQPPRPPYAEATLRVWWSKYWSAMSTLGTVVEFAPRWERNVALSSGEAWTTWASIAASYGYVIEKLSVWYPRFIANTTTRSLHGYGIAADVNYYLRGLNGYNTGWSWDKTDFTPELVNSLLAVRTNNGKQVFAWGGTWRTKQDYMHWYIACAPKDLETGIDPKTVHRKDDMNLTALVNAAFDSGNPAVTGSRSYWLGLAETDPQSPEWYDLFKAMLTPVPSGGLEGTYTISPV